MTPVAVPALAWLKITDPDEWLPEVVPGTDLRVLLPEGERGERGERDDRFAILAEKLEGIGAQARRVRYLVEDEAVTADPGARHPSPASYAAAEAGPGERGRRRQDGGGPAPGRRGHVAPGARAGPAGEPAAGPASGSRRGDLARAALLAVANSPEAFRPGVRQIGGIPYAAMYPLLEEAPRYLHWLASQGLFGTLHPWCAIVSADLELRITWRMLQPARGSGRLLWACEQMATAAHAEQAVPQLWAAARSHGYASPDWPVAGRPRGCHLDQAGYQALLRERATATTIEAAGGQVRAAGPAGSVLAVWAGKAYRVMPIRRGHAETEQPARSAGAPGAAIFTWRGDYRGTGWLAAYTQQES